MLTSFNLAEALAWLTQHSGHTWTESELFSMCTRRGIPLHAAPPLEARCAVLEMAPGAPGGIRIAERLSWRKAILHPFRVGQLWQVGETEPAPVWEPMHDADAGRWAVFDPPVRVTREHLAIKRDTLRKVLGAWRNPSPVETRWRAEDAGVDEGRPAQHVAPAVVDLASRPLPAEPDTQHWKMRIQAEATAYWLRLRKVGANPTRASIRPHLLEWCRENNVYTPRNINPSDGYLRTHVLSAKHWTPPT